MSEPVLLLAQRAKEASRVLGVSSLQVRNDALDAMAACLREDAEAIIAANERDVAAAREKGTKDSLIDRLALDAARIEGIAHALEELRALPEVLNVVQQERTMYNGMQLQRVSVPLGVVAMVYEARPNVTADAAGICVKTGNACILRGGSLAFNSCMAITDSLRRALLKVDLPADCVQMVQFLRSQCHRRAAACPWPGRSAHPSRWCRTHQSLRRERHGSHHRDWHRQLPCVCRGLCGPFHS